jgi:hypothetical protein
MNTKSLVTQIKILKSFLSHTPDAGVREILNKLLAEQRSRAEQERIEALPPSRKAKRVETNLGHGTLTKLRVRSCEDIDDTTTTRYKLQIDGGTRDMDMDDIREALRDEYNTTPCGHSHDCCGCWYGGVSRITKRRGAILFFTCYARNY